MNDFTHLLEDPSRKVTLLGMALNVVLIFLKLWGGMVGHSTALIADGLHSISDLFSDFLVLWGLKIGEKGPDTDHHFGHGKIETIATMGIGILVVATGIGIGIKAASRIPGGSSVQPEFLVIIVALVSLATKEAFFHYTRITGERFNRPLLISNAWHHRSDALSSLVVLVGAATIRLKPEWGFMDFYAAILVSILIIKSGSSIFIEATKDIVDTAPDPELCRRIEEVTKATEGVVELQDIKIRRSGRYVLVYLEIGVKPAITVSEAAKIAEKLEQNIKDNLQEAFEVSVNVKPAGSPTIKC